MPTPPDAPCTRTVSPRLGRRPLVQGQPRGLIDDRESRRVLVGHLVRYGVHVALRSDAVLGQAAVLQGRQGDHPPSGR